MIQSKILQLKKESKLPNGLDFPVNTEFHIVMDVLYMQGYPVPANLQATIMGWIEKNPKLFREVHKG